MPKKKEKFFEISITVDTNDADYNTRVEKIPESDLNIIKPLIVAIKNFKPYNTKSKSGLDWNHSHNYPFGDCCREDLGEIPPREYYNFPEEVFDVFEEYLPYGNEYGFHTIESIEVTPYIKKTKLL